MSVSKPATNSKKGSYALIAVIAVSICLSIFAILRAASTDDKIDRLADLAEQQNQLLALMNPQNVQKMMQEQISSHEREKNLRAYKNTEPAYQNAQKQIDGPDHIYGNPKAEFSVIEFSDFDCPYCNRFHSTPKSVVDGSQGEINWVWKHFPVHPSARPLHVASECAAQTGGNRAFWTTTQMIFDAGGSRGIDPRELADKLPVDRDAFLACLNSPAAAQKVQADHDFGKQAGVTGTPATFIIHHASGTVTSLKGAVPQNQVEAAIAQLKNQVASEAMKGDL